MGKGRFGGGFPGGMGNMNQMMKQAKKLQEQLAQAQNEIQASEVEHSAAGGAIKVRVNGEHRVLGIEIKPEAVDPEDVELLQDMIVAAINGAMDQIDEMSQEKMGAFGSVPGLGGLF